MVSWVIDTGHFLKLFVLQFAITLTTHIPIHTAFVSIFMFLLQNSTFPQLLQRPQSSRLDEFKGLSL